MADTRIASGNPKQELAVNLDDHWEAMKSVDKVVVLGFRAHHAGYVIPNEYVACYVKEHPEKLIGFCSIDPHNRDAVEQFDYCIKNARTARLEAWSDIPEHASARRKILTVVRPCG